MPILPDTSPSAGGHAAMLWTAVAVTGPGADPIPQPAQGCAQGLGERGTAAITRTCGQDQTRRRRQLEPGRPP